MTTGCRNDLVKEALESIRSALVEYLKASCRRSLPMVRLTGQRKVRIEFYGLFNYYEGTENFPRFMDAYSYALQCAGLDSVFQALEGAIVDGGGSGHQLILSIEKFEDMCKEVLKE
jgi:hypothetical protein